MLRVVAHELEHGNIDDFSWELLEPYYRPTEYPGVQQLRGVHRDVDDPSMPSDEIYEVDDALAENFVNRAQELSKKYRVQITSKQIQSYRRQR